MSDYYLAIDIGASSGRHILGKVDNGIITLNEIHRFTNGIEKVNGHFCWNLEHLSSEILIGMKKAKEMNKIPRSISIDTWGVDFVLIDDVGNLVGDCISYRDHRTTDMPEKLSKIISEKELYYKTGIQKQSFNTIYQLMALKEENPEALKEAKHFMQIPDYLSYLLTGVIANEYTNATTTNLVNVMTKEWDWEILAKLKIPTELFQKELIQPGIKIGNLLESVSKEVGFDCNVVSTTSHDTASAFVAVPANDENSVYISSGTWSLLGVENKDTITSLESLKANFTNEGGYDGTIRYLKNIMGLWMIQNCRRNWGSLDSYDDLIDLAVAADINNSAIIDVNADVFLSPDRMVTAIKRYCREHCLTVPKTKGEVMLTVYRSLASNYKESIEELSEITNKNFTAINIVGGGSLDNLLNQMTANITGLPVYAGPTEGTALGNLIIQFIADGKIEDISTAREYIRNSFEIKTFTEQ
jgi:rhamnulokinase